MNQSLPWYQTASTKYALYGAAFGCLFPLVATILDILVGSMRLSFESVLQVQSTQPLHWIIDTAPFFLGLFASLAGRRQDRIIRLIAQLDYGIADRTAELLQVNKNLQCEIADHKRAEKALEISERRFHDIALSSADWIWEVDEHGIYTFASGRVKEILGYESQELIGKTPFELMPKDEAERIDKIFAGIAGDRRPIVDLENWNLTKNGEKVCLQTNAVPILGETGELLGYRGVDKDITERKQVEERERKLKEELERARRMESIGVLAGGVAHDLNNMLGPLVGYPELILLKLPDNSPVRKQIELIGKCAKDAADVIQDLLTLARRGRYEMVPVDLNDVVSGFLDSHVLARLVEENPHVRLETALDRTVQHISGSLPHLTKLIMNIMINSFDAMPGDGVLTIETSQTYLEQLPGGYDGIENGDYVVLKVRDTGIGIGPEHLDKIFEPYYSKKKMGISGSGLGLSVVYGVVKDHKGYYDVFSLVGEGTEFVLYFPVSNQVIDKKPDVEQDYGGQETILVVDDVEEQRQIASDLLSSLGYKVNVVVNGREAIGYLKKRSADVVVLDMIMEEDYDGLDTYRDIIKLHPGQQAVVVSGFSETDRVSEMRSLGAGPYVKKPYTRDDLGAAVRKVLGTIPANQV